MSAHETGDRAAFLARLRGRLAGGVPANLAHPLPPPSGATPVATSCRLDADDLVGSFVRNAEAVRVVVHPVAGTAVPQTLVADVVERHRVSNAVVSHEPEAAALVPALAGQGVFVHQVSTAASAGADLGVTGAVAAIATTGTLVQHSGAVGGRSASLLPPVHLCILPASRIVPGTAEVLRALDDEALPSNVVLVTGPSRSGDIEQIIALGVHGPVTVEVALLLDA